jgi:hypothetical protein
MHVVDQVRDELAAGELVPLPLAQGRTRVETLYLILADRDGAGPAARTLARMLTEEAGRFPAAALSRSMGRRHCR